MKSNSAPRKVLQHFPLIPWLLRIYRCRDIVELMQWHAQNKSTDGKQRFVADSKMWMDDQLPHISIDDVQDLYEKVASSRESGLQYIFLKLKQIFEGSSEGIGDLASATPIEEIPNLTSHRIVEGTYCHNCCLQLGEPY